MNKIQTSKKKSNIKPYVRCNFTKRILKNNQNYANGNKVNMYFWTLMKVLIDWKECERTLCGMDNHIFILVKCKRAE